MNFTNGNYEFSKLLCTEIRIIPVLSSCEMNRNFRMVFICPEKVLLPTHLISHTMKYLRM